MNGPDGMTLVSYALLLVLPVAALAARRIPLGQAMRMALMWFGIFAIGLILATLWTRNRNYVNGFLVDAGLSRHVVTGSTVEIPSGEGGHFYADVLLNGVHRRMLIDTGATQTTLSRATARAVGISSGGDMGVLVSTANGTVLNHRAMLDTLDLGSIHATALPILVNDSDGVDLLGIDFLARLKSWRSEGNRLILEPYQS